MAASAMYPGEMPQMSKREVTAARMTYQEHMKVEAATRLEMMMAGAALARELVGCTIERVDTQFVKEGGDNELDNSYEIVLWTDGGRIFRFKAISHDYDGEWPAVVVEQG